jgi:hypothetical protein
MGRNTHLGDVVLLQIFRAFGERFAVCSVCGHGFFRFGRAQYCSRACSDVGRKAKYRRTRRLQNPTPRRKSILARPPGQSGPDITSQLRSLQEYLRRPNVWGAGVGGAGCNNVQEAESAISEVLEKVWGELAKGREIANLHAYGFILLKRAASQHWGEFDGLSED